MPRILLVEDEDKVRRSLLKGFTEEGFDVVTAEDGAAGLDEARAGKFDCLILDWMLPKRSGLELLCTLRTQGDRTPIILLTARRAIDDRVRGLENGADDYLAKPFAFAELLARVRVCLRRKQTAGRTLLRVGDLQLDCIRRVLLRGQRETQLTDREFELLHYLVQHRDEIVTRDMIARDVWKDVTGVPTNVIEVYVTYVRKKLESLDAPRCIHTIRGVGYRFRTGK